MAWFTTLLLFIITFFSGFSVFIYGKWNVNNFLTYYIGVPIFLGEFVLNDELSSFLNANISTALWGISWIILRDKIIPLRDIDLSEIELIEREREMEVQEKKLPWYRVLV
jgi:yeast amino acid transporter